MSVFSRVCRVFAAALVALSAGSAFGAAQTYDDTNGSNVWNLTTQNWDLSAVVWTNGNTATFAGAPETVTINSAISTAGITFGVSGYTLTQGSGSLTNTGGVVSSNATGTNIITSNVLMSGAGTHNLQQAAGGTLAVLGNITQNGVVRIGITRTGSGGHNVVLAGNNSFTDGVVMGTGANGKLHMNSNLALGSGPLIGGTSDFSADNTSGVGVTLTNSNFAWSGVNTLTFTGTNDLSFGAGEINMSASNRTLAVNGSTVTAAGITDGAESLLFTKSGNGTLVITGASSHDGGTTVSTGTMLVGHATSFGTGTLAWNGATLGALSDLSGGNAVGNTTTLGGTNVVIGTNNLQLTGTVTATATRTLTNNISGGTFTLSNTSALAISSNATATNTLTLNGSGNTVISGAIIHGLLTTGGNFAYSGIGSLTLRGNSTYNGTTSFTHGAVTIDAANGGALFSGTNLTLAGKLTYTGLANGSSALTFGTFTLTTPSGSTPAGTGSQLIVNGGAGTTLTLGAWTRGANATLHMDISAGTVISTNPQVQNGVIALGTTGAAYTVADATGLGFATISGGQVARYTGASTLAGGASAGTTNFIMDVNPTTAGTGGIYEGGVHNATVTGSYTLQLNNTSGAAATLNLATQLTISGRGLLYTGTNDVIVSGSTLGSNALELIVHAHGTGKLTINSALGTGNASLTKTGPGQMVLTSANVYTGVTEVSGGTLTIKNNTALGTSGSNTVVGNGATLELDGSGGDLTVAGEGLSLVGAGLAANPAGSLRNIAGNNSWTGNIAVFGATANNGAPTSIHASTGSSLLIGGTIDNNTNLITFNTVGTGAITANGIISDLGGLTKTGAGNLSLGGANTYTGNTTISGGKLILAVGGTIAASPRIVVGDSVDNNAAQLDITAAGITLAATQTLAGHGTVVGHVTGVAGTRFHPGNNAVGTLTINNGNFTTGAASVGLEIVSAASYDRIALTGTGTLDVTGGNLAIAEQPNLNVGEIYFILTNEGGDAVVGNFASFRGVATNLTQGVTFNLRADTATQWQISYEASFEGTSFSGGNDIAIQVIPEPGMLGVIGLGLVGLLKRRRAR